MKAKDKAAEESESSHGHREREREPTQAHFPKIVINNAEGPERKSSQGRDKESGSKRKSLRVREKSSQVAVVSRNVGYEPKLLPLHF